MWVVSFNNHNRKLRYCETFLYSFYVFYSSFVVSNAALELSLSQYRICDRAPSLHCYGWDKYGAARSEWKRFERNSFGYLPVDACEESWWQRDHTSCNVLRLPLCFCIWAEFRRIFCLFPNQRSLIEVVSILVADSRQDVVPQLGIRMSQEPEVKRQNLWPYYLLTPDCRIPS